MKKIILGFVLSMATFIYIGSLHLFFPSRTLIQCGISQWFVPNTRQPRESKFQDSRNGSYNCSQTNGSNMGHNFNKLKLEQKLDKINDTRYDSQNQDNIGGKLETLNFLPIFKKTPSPFKSGAEYKEDIPYLPRGKKRKDYIKSAMIEVLQRANRSG